MEHFSCCKLEIFIPESHFPTLCEALWSVDAGHIGNYDRCLSHSRVTSCWRPLAGAAPYLGETGRLCTQEEIKVEVTWPDGPAGGYSPGRQGRRTPMRSR